jgi:hypothetical protein
VTRAVRQLLVACVSAGLIVLPCSSARASDVGADQAPAVPVETASKDTSKPLVINRQSLFAKDDVMSGVASQRVMRQAVASTSQHNFILGATAAAMVVGGVALIAYSTTPSCKQDQAISSKCDRDKVLGAVGISGGAVMFVLWALSK